MKDAALNFTFPFSRLIFKGTNGGLDAIAAVVEKFPGECSIDGCLTMSEKLVSQADGTFQEDGKRFYYFANQCFSTFYSQFMDWMKKMNWGRDKFMKRFSAMIFGIFFYF
uniref:Uncharacterized protein n=1 Tax=Ditylenchus dipsaci TaxID=166011 RepID=A0A915DN17_9BILA